MNTHVPGLTSTSVTAALIAAMPATNASAASPPSRSPLCRSAAAVGRHDPRRIRLQCLGMCTAAVFLMVAAGVVVPWVTGHKKKRKK